MILLGYPTANVRGTAVKDGPFEVVFLHSELKALDSRIFLTKCLFKGLHETLDVWLSFIPERKISLRTQFSQC